MINVDQVPRDQYPYDDNLNGGKSLFVSKNTNSIGQIHKVVASSSSTSNMYNANSYISSSGSRGKKIGSSPITTPPSAIDGQLLLSTRSKDDYHSNSNSNDLLTHYRNVGGDVNRIQRPSAMRIKQEAYDGGTSNGYQAATNKPHSLPKLNRNHVPKAPSTIDINNSNNNNNYYSTNKSAVKVGLGNSFDSTINSLSATQTMSSTIQLPKLDSQSQSSTAIKMPAVAANGNINTFKATGAMNVVIPSRSRQQFQQPQPIGINYNLTGNIIVPYNGRERERDRERERRRQSRPAPPADFNSSSGGVVNVGGGGGGTILIKPPTEPYSHSLNRKINNNAYNNQQQQQHPLHAVLTTGSQPVIQETSGTTSNNASVTSFKGLKPGRPEWINQDNFFIIKTSVGSDLYCVLDGHGEHGHLVSQKCKMQLPNLVLSSHFDVKRAFALMQQQLLESNEVDASCSGATCVLSILSNHSLTLAHTGDSRAVLGKRTAIGGYAAVVLTQDHKPDRPDERRRILGCGGHVGSRQVMIDTLGGRVASNLSTGPCRVWYKHGSDTMGLAMSRSLGDGIVHTCGVSAEPEILQMTLDPSGKDEFIILATDGLWDVIDSQQAVRIVGSLILKHQQQNQVLLTTQSSTSSQQNQVANSSSGNMSGGEGNEWNTLEASEHLCTLARRRWESISAMIDDITCLVVKLDTTVTSNSSASTNTNVTAIAATNTSTVTTNSTNNTLQNITNNNIKNLVKNTNDISSNSNITSSINQLMKANSNPKLQSP